jgi:hypothetical protein
MQWSPKLTLHMGFPGGMVKGRFFECPDMKVSPKT